MTNKRNGAWPYDNTGRHSVPMQARLAALESPPEHLGAFVRRSWEARRFPIGRGTKRCLECLGRGMVAVNKRYEHDGYDTVEKGRVCPTCDGRGYTPTRRARGQSSGIQA